MLRLSMSLEAWYLSIKPDKFNARQFQLKIEKLQCITYRFPGEGNGNPLQYSWEIPWTEEPVGLQFMESQRVGRDWSDLACTEVALVVNNLTCQCRRYKSCRFNPWVRKIPWRRKCQPIPVFLPGESHGQRSLGATVHRVAKSRTWLKWLCTHACS